MKILFVSKKHHKMITQMLEQMEKSASKESPLRGMLGNLGEPFTMHIRPYLKKIRVMDASRFEMKMPTPELDIEPYEPPIGWKAYRERVRNTTTS